MIGATEASDRGQGGVAGGGSGPQRTRGVRMTFTAIDIEQNGPGATILIKPFERTQAEGAKHAGFVDVHTAIAEALERLRWDDQIRIVVITGAEDGEFYWAPGPGYYSEERMRYMNPAKRPAGRWSHEQGAT